MELAAELSSAREGNAAKILDALGGGGNTPKMAMRSFPLTTPPIIKFPLFDTGKDRKIASRIHTPRKCTAREGARGGTTARPRLSTLASQERLCRHLLEPQTVRASGGRS